MVAPDFYKKRVSEQGGPVQRAVVFVVDSAIFQKEVRDVAELLYSLLTDSVVVKNAPTLLVACNKQGRSSLDVLGQTGSDE